MKFEKLFNELSDNLSKKCQIAKKERDKHNPDSKEAIYQFGFIDGIISANQDINKLASKIGYALIRGEKLEI